MSAMREISKMKFAVIVIAVLLLESVAIPVAFYDVIKIDLLLIILVFFAFFVNRAATLWMALLLGFIKDTFSNSIFGVEMFALGVASLFLIGIARKFDRENMVVIMLTTALLSMVALGISFLFHVPDLVRAGGVWLALGKVFTVTTCTVICSWPAVKLFKRLTARPTQQLEFRF